MAAGSSGGRGKKTRNPGCGIPDSLLFIGRSSRLARYAGRSLAVVRRVIPPRGGDLLRRRQVHVRQWRDVGRRRLYRGVANRADREHFTLFQVFEVHDAGLLVRYRTRERAGSFLTTAALNG